jgi:hypothetical protein
LKIYFISKHKSFLFLILSRDGKYFLSYLGA